MLVESNPKSGQITVGADKGYDARNSSSNAGCTASHPYVAQNTSRKSAADDRTTRHAGYAISQRIRKRIEEIFGWAKTVEGFRKTRYRGVDRTQLAAYFVGAAYNLVRMARLLPAPG
jgi:IS5 family transposase